VDKSLVGLHSVRPQRCRSLDLYVARVRSRDAASTQATLAAFSGEDRLQAGSAGLQVPQWPGTVVSRLRISSYGLHGESTAAALAGSTADLIIPRVRCATIGGRAFPVAVAHVWNTLPSSVTSSSSLAVFKSRLKADLFTRCYVV